jgi:hypothetical protein
MGISTECRRPSAIFQNQIVGVTNEFLQDTPKSNFRIHHHRELHSHPERTKKPNILDKKQISISYLFIKEKDNISKDQTRQSDPLFPVHSIKPITL